MKYLSNKFRFLFQKLTKAYGADVLKYQYLEDLIVLNVNVDDFAANALLWLKRGLQLICTFFENIYHHINITYPQT